MINYKKTLFSIIKKLNINKKDFIMYGGDNNKAKLSLDLLKKKNKKNAKIILITSINPTPFGEGKTTINIALSMALNKNKKIGISLLREPSIGLNFGIKKKGTGSGKSIVIPEKDINLNFNNDLHIITYVHNFISAKIYNHIYFGNKLKIYKNVFCDRVIDINDEFLKKKIILKKNNKKLYFNFVCNSEIMSILTLAKNEKDFFFRLEKIIIGYTKQRKKIFLKDLKIMNIIKYFLKDVIKPNLVQTIEGTPAIIHGGSFANFSIGVNSIISTKIALKLSDFVVIETGFGTDLGAEKFFNIVCRNENLNPDCVVLVVSIRALKYNGSMKLKNLNNENLFFLKKGLKNLKQHYKNLLFFTKTIIIALNVFLTDTEKEKNMLKKWAKKYKFLLVQCFPFEKGSLGCKKLAEKIILKLNKKIKKNNKKIKFLYKLDKILKTINIIVKKIYNVNKISFNKNIKQKIEILERENNKNFPICIAKTQYFFKRNNLDKFYDFKNYKLKIKNVYLQNGSGYIVVILK